MAKWISCNRHSWVAMLVITLGVAAHAQTLTWLGVLPGGYYSNALDVSNNGVVVGAADIYPIQSYPIRWQNGVMLNLGTLGGDLGSAESITPDGSVIVGWSRNSRNRERAFRWTAATGMVDIGSLGNDLSNAYNITPDGRVIVGASNYAFGPVRAFRWENGVMQDLGYLGGYQQSWAYGVSADGNVVVGMADVATNARHAFRWTAQTGMQSLGTLGGLQSEAIRVSYDGTRILGRAQDASNQLHSVIWTPQGVIDLGVWTAQDFTADGSIVVGWMIHSQLFRQTAIRYRNGQREFLEQIYAHLLRDGSRLYIAYGISPNGRYIVGYGLNMRTGRNEGWILDTGCAPHNGDVDGNGCISDTDLLAVLFAFGQSGSALGSVDTNCDGVVNDADLLTVLFNFGQGC